MNGEQQFKGRTLICKTGKKFFRHSEIRFYLAPILGSVILFIFGNILAPGFLSLKSILSLLALSSMLVLVCVAQQLIVLGQGIGLSVSAYMILGVAWGGALSGGTTIGLIKAALLMSVLAAVCGLLEGISIRKWRVPAMVATLSMGRVVSSSYMAITKGNPAGAIAPALKTIGMGSIGGVRWILILAVVVTIAVELILRKTRFGKSLYLVGTNERAARIAGIKAERIGIFVYVIAAVCATLAGFILLGMVGAMQADMTNTYLMTSVAAVVIGGTSLSGGRGTFLGAAFGAIFMTLLSNVLTIVNMAEGLRNALQGIILLVILAIYSRGPKLRQ